MKVRNIIFTGIKPKDRDYLTACHGWKVITIHPEGDKNICANIHDKKSLIKNSWHISLHLKKSKLENSVMNQEGGMPATHTVMTLAAYKTSQD